MTKEQLIESFTMKVCGYKHSDIAKKFGVSEACLRAALQRVITSKGLHPSVYPSVNKYMLENGYSMEEMSVLMGVAYRVCDDFLKGRTKAYGMIVKLLELTGLTFEEVFLSEREEENKNAE